MLPREDIALLCKIGNGAFGEVWKARANPPLDGQELVAVKTLKVILDWEHHFLVVIYKSSRKLQEKKKFVQQS